MLSLMKKTFPGEKHVYEFDGDLYVEKENALSIIGNIDNEPGAKKILTDFNNQAFARLIYIESEPKYAELLAKKKINDSGEFDESIDLHIHKKQKIGDLTKLYCTPISAHVLEHYKNLVASHSDGIALAGMHDALWAITKKKKLTKPTVLIITHKKSYEILVASAKQVYFAGRFNAFEYDAESINSIWEIINSEIKKIQIELSESITDAYLYHTGIDRSVLNIVEQKLSLLSINLHVPGLSSKKNHNVHLLMQALNLSDLMNTPLDKIYYFFQKQFSSLCALTIILSLGMFSLSAVAKWKTQALNNLTHNQTVAINQFTLPVINIPANLDQNVNFYQDLKKTAFERQISNILSDLSVAASDYMTINKLNFKENQSINIIEIDGIIDTNFDDAYQSYKKMIASLKNDGYSVAEELFTTDINQSSFSFALEYK